MRQQAINKYGDICEWEGCLLPISVDDVYCLDRREHRDMEKHLSMLEFGGTRFDNLQYIAIQTGYGLYSNATKKLPKNMRVRNLVCLCPRHYVQAEGMKMKIEAYIPKRL